jgi:uncharacterized alpha-E superfamily protein
MLSRVAESLYWIGRYMERAENVARLIDVNLQLRLDLPQGTSEQWKPLVATTGDLLRYLERSDFTTRESAIEFLTFDSTNPNSISCCLRAARENARAIRQTISSEMWEHLNATYLHLSNGDCRVRALESPHEFFSEIKMAGRLFEGLTDDTLSHGEGWHFCRTGRLQERADKTSRILDLKYHLESPSLSQRAGPIEDIEWSALLRSAGALELYRKRHGRFSRERIVDFLLLDREFPRSVQHCLSGAEESLHAITGTPMGTFRNSAEQLLGQLRSELAFALPQEIIADGLHEYLDFLQLKLNLIGDGVTVTFFVAEPAGIR